VCKFVFSKKRIVERIIFIGCLLFVLFRALLLVAFVAFASATSVHFKDCGSKGTVSGVDVDPCDNPDKCSLKKGTSPKITINFAPNAQVTSMKAKATGQKGGQDLPFSLPNPDACSSSGLTCPIDSGKSVSYHTTVPVKPEYPDWELYVKFELIDQNGNDQACVIVSTKIVE